MKINEKKAKLVEISSLSVGDVFKSCNKFWIVTGLTPPEGCDCTVINLETGIASSWVYGSYVEPLPAAEFSPYGE